MKRFSNIPTLCAALLAGIMFTGCQKEVWGNGQSSSGDVEVAFAAGSLLINPVELHPLAQVQTRASDEAAMAVGTTFRTVAYAKDAAVTATPEVESTYKTADATGAVVTTAVTANGSPNEGETAPDPIYLKRDAYDFYYFSPALPVTSGEITGLTGGVDYMTVKQAAVEVQPGADNKFHIEKVQFVRLCSRLDIKVTPKSANSFIGSITLGTAGAKIEGLAATAGYTLGDAALANVTGTETKAFTADDFVSSGTGANAILSTESKEGAIVLPVTGRSLMVTLDLIIDNTPVPVNVTLPGTTLAAGYKYLLDLKVDRQGAPTFTVTVSPWTEGGTNEIPALPIDIGSYRDGGVVFWVDPADATHYKVVSVDETSASWSNAVTWAGNYGDGWRLPVEGELTALYNARRDNGGITDISQSVIDKAITALNATTFGTDAYWSATYTDDSNAQGVKLSDGTVASAVKTTTLAARAVKELPVIDYTLQPANCYITQPGKIFKFDATLKPQTFNGGAGSNPSTAAVDANLGNNLLVSEIDKVEVVWQTAINHSSPADGTKADMIIQSIFYNSTSVICTITPHATGCGNALIAAYAADGTTILWNWHIWVTEGKVQANVNTGNMSLNGGGKFMDRNLGALAATSTQPAAAQAYKYFGLLYQHGRPTPFTGQGIGTAVNTYTAIYDKNAAKITGGIGNAGFTQIGTAVADVTSAIKTPNIYYSWRHSSGSNTWYNFADTSLWSDYGTNKSIYDPCPYGYRVPINGSFTGFSRTTWTYDDIIGGGVWSSTWWSASGYRNNGSGSLAYIGNAGHYWTSSRYPSLAYTSNLLFFDYSGIVGPNYYYHRSFAMSMRCVEDK